MKIKYPFPLADLKIKLARTPCLGVCPVYELTIDGEGGIEYNGEMFVKEVGFRKDEVSPLDVLDLFEFAIGIGFFEMENEYDVDYRIYVDDAFSVNVSGTEITDLPSCNVSIQAGNKIKTVCNYLGAPKRLRQLENKIEKLANSKRWVKGTIVI